MPAGDPFGYLTPQMQQQLLGEFFAPPEAAFVSGMDAAGQMTRNQKPPLDLLAAGVRGRSLGGFGNKFDSEVQQQAMGGNRRAALELQIRQLFGTRGMPGGGAQGRTPIAPQQNRGVSKEQAIRLLSGVG